MVHASRSATSPATELLAGNISWSALLLFECARLHLQAQTDPTGHAAYHSSCSPPPQVSAPPGLSPDGPKLRQFCYCTTYNITAPWRPPISRLVERASVAAIVSPPLRVVAGRKLNTCERRSESQLTQLCALNPTTPHNGIDSTARM